MSKIWNLEQFGKSVAIQDEFGNQVTYDVLNSEAQRLAEAVGERCLVFSLCRNEIGSVAGYVGFLSNGIVPVMLNSHLDEKLLENLLSTYHPSFLWAPEDQVGQFPNTEKV